MNIAICDDEKSIRDDIERRIGNYFSGFDIRQYINGDKLLSDGWNADIVFLDIQMTGRNGIEVAKLLRARNDKLVIIFITAVEEYVFRAFDVQAFHYLVKPLDKVKFYEVLNRAVNYVERLNAMKDTEQEAKRTMMIRSGSVHTNVAVEDILYAEVYNRKIILHTKQEKLEYYGKLTDLENTVGQGFFRPHRAYLVNMRYINSYDSTTIYLPEESIPIAKAKHADFVREYLRYHARMEREGE